MPDEAPSPSVDADPLPATTPFKALLAASSLFAAVLGIAGFSLRWNYYYNFGLQDLVLAAPWSSLAVSSIEMVRSPDNVATLVVSIVAFLLPLQLLLMMIGRLGRSPSPHVRRVVDIASRTTGLGSPLVVDVVRAALILFVAFRAGGIVGARDYLTNVVESTSRLARVTVVASGDATKLPVACHPDPFASTNAKEAPAFVGAASALDRLAGGAACSDGTRSWRLLYRDEKFVYVFLTVTEAGRRPDLLAIPRGDSLALVLQ